MQFVVYLLFYPLLWLISILPFRVLYFVSDCTFVLLYYVFGYRKKTVRNNLLLAFPDYSKQQRLQIEKKSFHHLTDTIFETIKTMSISRSEIEKRFTFPNLDVYLDLEKKGKPIVLLCAHYASYEWAVSMNHHINFEGFAIYKKLKNPYFDKLVRNIRSRFKATLISTRDTSEEILKNQKNNHLGVYGLASDQLPRPSENNHWYPFMGIETPIHVGGEVLAKKFDMNAVLLKGKRVKRGYYEGTFEVLSEDIHAIPDFKLSENFIKKVEEMIRDAPEFYLWTHKRWKRKK